MVGREGGRGRVGGGRMRRSRRSFSLFLMRVRLVSDFCYVYSLHFIFIYDFPPIITLLFFPF